MKKRSKGELKDQLRPEYDLRGMLKRGVRGKYAKRFRSGTNLVLLDPDVSREFSDDRAVNEALRVVIRLARIPKKSKREEEASVRR